MDTLVNYETVKMFGMEDEESAAYEQLQKRFQDEYIWFRVTLNSLNFGQALIQTTGLGAAMVFAAQAASRGQITPGDFVLINSYVLQLFQPLFVSIVRNAVLRFIPAMRISLGLLTLCVYKCFGVRIVFGILVQAYHAGSDRC